MRLVRGIAVAAVLALCVGVVIAYQSARPAAATPNPVVFVPSPGFYKHFSPSVRASVADAYWLYAIQYYGEHLNSDHRLDSLPAMLRLVTSLSPHFKEAYFFGAFAMIDIGRPDIAYALLEQGFKANARDWRFPFYLGFFAYSYASGQHKDAVAAEWYAQAARLPGAPPFVSRLAAELATKGNQKQTAIDLWTQVYCQGDKYARQKAVSALDGLLPTDKVAREKAVAALEPAVPQALFDQFVADLFQGYRQ
ncbi:MAG: hypothetical protein ACXVP1_00235 [Thermoleophilia bacterium]